MTELANRSFVTPRGWRSGHLQSIRSRVLPRPWALADISTETRFLAEVSDGSGDRLAVTVHTPQEGRDRLPLVVLIHGLGGSAEASYIRATARGLLRVGFPVARVDLRGAGDSGHHSVGLYHAGRTEDLRDVLRQVQTHSDTGLALIGYSLGGNAVLKLAGEPLGDLAVRAVVAVSAPLDLAVGVEHLHRMMFGGYERFIMNGLREDMARPGPRSGLTPAEAAALARIRTVVEFDDLITAPRNGWADAAQYYAVNSSAQYLPHISIPTLIIHALDDPLVPVGPYQAINWDRLAAMGYVETALTPHGGHVGFHQRGKVYPWYVGQAINFFARQISPA